MLDTHRLAALKSEGSVLPQFVVQVVEVEAKGSGSLVERYMEVGAQLRHIQCFWFPDCKDRNKF